MNSVYQELQHFLLSRTEGEAPEIVRGAERNPGLEQCQIVAALYDPLAAGRILDDSMQILPPPQAAQIEDRAHNIQAWGNLEQRHRERTGDQLPNDMRLAIILSVPNTPGKRVDNAATFFPDYAQMKARSVAVINSRTRGLAPMMMGNLSDEDSYFRAGSDESVESEDGELYRLEIRTARKSSLNLVMNQAIDKRMFPLWTHWSHQNLRPE